MSSRFCATISTGSGAARPGCATRSYKRRCAARAYPARCRQRRMPATKMTVPAVSSDDRQATRLRRSRAVASLLLLLAAALFAGTLLVPEPGEAVLLLRAVAEAALVGGLADWF